MLLEAMETRVRGSGRMDESINLDGYRNELTGLGDFLRDKTFGGKRGGPDFEVQILAQYDYELRWRGSDLGGRIVESIPDEMTRAGWEISIQPSDEDEDDDDDGENKADAFPLPNQGMLPPIEKPEPPMPEASEDAQQQVEEIEGKLDELDAVALLTKALQYERAYGGGAILLGVNDGHPLDQPLDEERIKSVDWLNCFTGGYDGEIVAWSFYNDPGAARHGQPEMYMLRNLSSPNQAPPVPGASQGATKGSNLITWVHESRLLVFPGTAPSQRARVQLRGWGDSVFTRVDRVLSQYDQTWSAVANIMSDFSQGVIQVKNLIDMLAANGDSRLQDRARAINLSRSIANVLMLDSEEEFKRDTASIAGVADVLQQFALRLAAAADMPVTLLMGQAPAGLNATGASDIRFFYDRIASRQRRSLLPKIKKLIRLIMLSKDGPTGGSEPGRWNIEFRSLYQMTESEKADLRLKTAQADQIEINDGVLNPGEVTVSRYAGSEYSTKTVVDFDSRREMHEANEIERQRRVKEAEKKAEEETTKAQEPPTQVPVISETVKPKSDSKPKKKR